MDLEDLSSVQQAIGWSMNVIIGDIDGRSEEEVSAAWDSLLYICKGDSLEALRFITGVLARLVADGDVVPDREQGWRIIRRGTTDS